MAKRFKNLDAALKYLRAPSATAGTAPVNAPAGSQLAEYQEFKSGKKTVTYNRDAESRPGNLGEAYIKAFALPAADTKVFLVDFSNRAKTAIANTGVTNALLGHADDSPEASRAYGYTPARATIILIAAGEGTTTPSKITGKPYKKKNNNTYTYPFGRATANPTYSEQKGAILNAVAKSNTNRGVSFKPEIYR